MDRPDVIVVGSGVFGSTIARWLGRLGKSVLVLDDRRPYSGTSASGFLMKPSWMTFLPKEGREAALKILEELYGLEELEFRVWPSRKTAKVFRVSREAVLYTGDLRFRRETVLGCQDDGTVHLKHESLTPRLATIVAAGSWAHQLVPDLVMRTKVGVSFRWRGLQLEENVIRPWAPYKQVVGVNEPDGVWAGDGTAILRENWDVNASQRIRKCSIRVRNHLYLGNTPDSEVTVGYRPVAKESRGALVKKVGPNLWVATGGAKNGTVQAGLAAHVIGGQI